MRYFSTIFHIVCTEEYLLGPSQELLADAMGECGYEAFEDTDDGIKGYIQDTLYDESLVHKAIEEFPMNGVAISFTTEAIPDQDWNEAWEKEGFEPITVKNLVTIYDARNTNAEETFSTPVTIGIHATNAFGTGTHETTRMMVETLLELPLKGKRVLDCGCGTGILAIAALKCGAKEAVGFDIDEWSADNAKHNAELNGVGDNMHVLCGDANVLSHVEGIFDVIVANINRNILLADLQKYYDVLASGGIIILSGFYEDDAPLILQEAEKYGLHELSRKTDNNWCSLLLPSACTIHRQ